MCDQCVTSPHLRFMMDQCRIPGDRVTAFPIECHLDQVRQGSCVCGAGEGAGYAGGIMSAGIDGIKVAEALALEYLTQHPQ